jgi:hypothetical protein
MQGFYTYIPETNHISMEYSVVVSVHGAYNAISNIKSFVLLHQYFPQYVCRAQYGCFM